MRHTNYSQEFHKQKSIQNPNNKTDETNCYMINLNKTGFSKITVKTMTECYTLFDIKKNVTDVWKRKLKYLIASNPPKIYNNKLQAKNSSHESRKQRPIYAIQKFNGSYMANESTFFKKSQIERSLT